ncbi:MAG: type II toxin-antitoxin system RelE/ParE family toxin [Deltaproteobacteria bacterium]|nr:type II toxin-antitoxin system RelE/ParE family toxin [Deltaproteobacteria bacterium]
MRIEILDEAEKDLVDGFAFYDRQSKGLGNYFLDSIFSDIESLHLYAGIHAFHFGYHRLLAKRFPFAIYYRVENDTVQVYAILDCRRNPVWIRDRLA